MNTKIRFIYFVMSLMSAASLTGGLVGCGGSGGAAATTVSSSFTVGGTLGGLLGTVVLQNNGADDLTLTQNGSFTFATTIAAGSVYAVTVKTNPSTQACKVSNGSGTVSAKVTNVSVNCDTSVVFQSSRKLDGTDAANANSTNNIWTLKGDGTGLTALTTTTASGTNHSNPQWSPDDSKIVFSSSRKLDGTDAANANDLGNNISNIWTVMTDGTGLTALTTATCLGGGVGCGSTTPQWSPDGTKLVFVSGRKPDGSDTANSNSVNNVWVVKADGTGLTALTTTTAVNTGSANPQWSPDGTKIVFQSNRKLDGSDAANANNTSNIWTVKADGTGLTALTMTTAFNTANVFPKWSPDGSKLVFYSARNLDGTDTASANAVLNIWVMKADGTGLAALTTVTAANVHHRLPQWSPDGSKLVFYSAQKLDGSDAANTNNTTNIWTVKADGTGLTALTTTTAVNANNASPQWSLDGSKIIFQSNRKLDGSDAANSNNVNNIWTINADGTGLTALTTTTAALEDHGNPQFQ